MIKLAALMGKDLELGPEDLCSSPASTKTNDLKVNSDFSKFYKPRVLNKLFQGIPLNFYKVLYHFKHFTKSYTILNIFSPISLCSRYISLSVDHLWPFFPIIEHFPLLFLLPRKCFFPYLSSDLIFGFQLKYHFLSKAFYASSI